MPVVEAIILGLIQGLAEFIPVSSSAHLVIVPWLLGWTSPLMTSLAFDVALHIGTLVALLAFFAKDWQRLIAAWFRSIAERKIGDDVDRRMAWFIVLACIPGAVAGVLLEGRIERLFHPVGSPILRNSMLLMALIIAALGALLYVADRLAKHARAIGAMTRRDALLIGLAQALAIFPGVSRSGATITAGLALGLEREAAARFSFLLSAPIIAGAGAKSLLELGHAMRAGSLSASELPLVGIGFAVAAISGFFCIKVLLDFLKSHSTRAFAYYRLALAVLVVAVALIRG
jgi:undecaprenyl-diphosphatase